MVFCSFTTGSMLPNLYPYNDIFNVIFCMCRETARLHTVNNCCKKLKQRLKTKGLNKPRFREFRRLYLVYPQLREEILQYIMAGNEIRHSLTAEFTEPIRHSASAELQQADKEYNKWINPATKIFNKIPYTT